jgi:hypothetical protein
MPSIFHMHTKHSQHIVGVSKDAVAIGTMMTTLPACLPCSELPTPICSMLYSQVHTHTSYTLQRFRSCSYDLPWSLSHSAAGTVGRLLSDKFAMDYYTKVCIDV